MERAHELGKAFLFKDLSHDELEKLVGIAEKRSVSAGSELFREGRASKELLVIQLGSVKVLKRDRNGVDEEITTLGTGSYLGEVELVRGDHESAATIVAIEPTTVLCFARGKIEELCEADPSFGHHFYRAIASGLARRLANTTSDAAYYRSQSVRQRD